MPGGDEKGWLDVKMWTKKEVPSGAGTPTGTNGNGVTIILAKTIYDVNPHELEFREEVDKP